MNIGIIGGGAIGLLFSTYMSLNHSVTLITKSHAQADKIEKNGILLSNTQREWKANITATANFDVLQKQNFIIIALKQYDLEYVRDSLSNLPVNVPLLFIQNGIGHMSLLETLPQDTILIGIVEHGVRRLTENSIDHVGVGVTNIACYRGKHQNLNKYIPASATNLFPFIVHTDYREIQLSKLVANSVINPLTAILGVENGVLIDNAYFYNLFRKLHTEVTSVFPEIDAGQSFEKLVHICENTRENQSSMLVDIKMGRKTEIDAILGEVLQRAEELKVALPITQIIFEILKGKEAKLQ